MISKLLGWFGRPSQRRERRKMCRYTTVKDRVFLGWWEGPEFRTTTAVIKDVSLGGASIMIDAPPPEDDIVWISLYKIPPTDWVEASIMEVEKLPRTSLFVRRWILLRIKFFESCSYEVLKTGIAT